MNDLISREAAIDALKKRYNDPSRMAKLEELVWAVEAVPSAEPERKTGKWIDEKINSYTSRTYCSECGSSAPFVYESNDYYGNHAHGETVKTKFCPNCGADMRGKQ